MDIFFYLLKEHFVKLHDNIDVPSSQLSTFFLIKQSDMDERNTAFE